MSLLMDALRKAEQDKKEAEERRKTTAGEMHTENAPRPDRAAIPEHTDEHEIPAIDPAPSPAFSLSLQDTGDHTEIFPAPAERRDTDFAPGAPSLDVADTDQYGQVSPTQAMGLSLEDREDDEDLFDETFHNADIDLESVPGLYEETMQGEEYEKAAGPSFEETLPGVPAVQLARDLGEEFQPTPVAAQTVFTAASTARRRGGFPWAGLSIGLVIVAVAVGVFTYDFITPELQQDFPASVGNNLEGALVPPPPAALPQTGVIAQPTAAGQTAPTQPGIVPPATETLPAVVATQTQPGSEVGASQGPETLASTEPESAPPAEPEAVTAPESAQAPPAPEVPAAEPAAAPAVQESLPDDIDVPPGMIRISRSKAPDDRGTRLMDAYAAWQTGDREEAGRLYSEVMENYPGNRDALLGLAAIALTGGDTDTARKHYASLLSANPGDELARAALIGLEREADPVSRESALKVLIQEYPERPYLYFNLGNVFAAGRRWAEAQQAFFEAYRLDPQNPDYANNLAVSLDRIGQYATAVDYYLTALDLAKTRAAEFDDADLLARIQQLENPGRP